MCVSNILWSQLTVYMYMFAHRMLAGMEMIAIEINQLSVTANISKSHLFSMVWGKWERFQY